MELFDAKGCLSEEGLQALVGGQLDETQRLEAAEHLAYCDRCMDRYTALLTDDVLEQPPRSARGAVMGTIWIRLMQNTWGRAAVATAVALVLLGCEVLFFAARPGRWKYDFVSVLVCLVLMAGCFCMAMLPLLWDELSGENQQTMNRLSTQAIDELYTACKRDAQDIAIRDISGRLYLSGPQVETLQQAAALPAGDTCLTLTVELFGPYDSAAAFARDCYTLTALAKQCTVPPEKLHFTWDARSPAESSLNTGSLLYTEDYSLDLSGAVQLDWTEQQMEQQTETEYLLDAENIPNED